MSPKKVALSKSKLKFFKKLLEEEREKLKKELKEIEIGLMRVAQSEAAGENAYEDSYADSGTATFERERDLSLERNVRDLLSRVEIALNKIEKGNFGICSHCGREIGFQRLEALPYADLCIECKKKEEKLR